MLQAINNIFTLYFYIIIVRIFLTWIPSIDWWKQPWQTLAQITDIYLNLFRRFIPPVGGLDLSPIVALIVLQIIQYLVNILLGAILV